MELDEVVSGCFVGMDTRFDVSRCRSQDAGMRIADEWAGRVNPRAENSACLAKLKVTGRDLRQLSLSSPIFLYRSTASSTGASQHTIAGYRDCFRLFLQFAKERLGKIPSQLQIEDLDAPFISLFLDHLERTRKNSARTRNARLAAIHSFFGYVALDEPAHALHCHRILAMPGKRYEQRPIEFLAREEIDALLAIPDHPLKVVTGNRNLLILDFGDAQLENEQTLASYGDFALVGDPKEKIDCLLRSN